MTTQPTIEFEKEFSEKLTIHKNIGQEIVITTVDKVRLCLMENRDLLTAKKEWLTPLGIFLALLTTLVAADFRDFYFKPEVWKAIYVLATLISFIWLIISGYKAVKNYSKGSIDTIVAELKAQDIQQSEQPQKEIQEGTQNMPKANVLVIESAQYGAQGKFSDVTKILSSRIVNGKLDVAVNNELVGDPVKGVAKKLTVSYLHNGLRMSKTVSENERLLLP